MSVYQGNFSCWNDVVMEFTRTRYAEEAEKEDALRGMPEPEEVLVAVYECESYEGSAVVVYRNGDKFYSVYGTHCSCYGLEDQWEPDELDRVDALSYWEKMAVAGYGLQERIAADVAARIKATKAASPAVEYQPIF